MMGFCGWFDATDGETTGSDAIAQADALLAAMFRAAHPEAVPLDSAPRVHDGGLHGIGLPALAGAGARHDRAPAVFGHGEPGLGLLLSAPPAPADFGAAGATIADLVRAGQTDLARLPERIPGPFALTVATPARRLLAIDRVGARSLFVWTAPTGAVFFSTRLAALTAAPGFGAVIDEQALFDYLYFHMVPSPGSIYRGVTKLLPGECLTFPAPGRSGRRSGSGDRRFYWQMPYRDDNPTGLPALKQTFRTLLPQVVGAAAADGGDRVGCFLSGGTDSSTVAGTLRHLRDAPIPTYSIGFAAEGYDEMGYARIAARHFDTRPREYYVTADDVVASIPLLAAFCDEPFANASIVPAYLCARFAASEGIDRLLAGDGGDEIFGGNERYANQWIFELYGRLPRVARGLLEPALRLPGLGAVAPLRKARSYVEQARVPLPDRLNTYNFLHRTPLAEIFEPDFLGRIDTGAPLASLREVYQRTASPSAINRMMHLDLKITLADNDLRKVNQACALAGIDVRYPLLDDRLLAFAASVPPTMQLKRTQLRWFFKQALADFLPPEIIAKRKQGFGLPVGLWMAEHAPLRELTHDSVSAFRRRGIVRPGYIDWLERQHREAHASYYGVMLWVLMMLEQWLAARGH